jgi:hypothetical protein
VDAGAAIDTNCPDALAVVNPAYVPGAAGSIAYVGETTFRFSGQLTNPSGEGWQANFNTTSTRCITVGGIYVGNGSVTLSTST